MAATESATTLAKLQHEVERLTTELGVVAARQSELRALLMEAHQQLLRRDVEFECLLATFQKAQLIGAHGNAGDCRPPQPLEQSNYLSYRQTLEHIKRVVERKVPVGAVLVVVSRGDNELMRLTSPNGWHFPQTPAGIYAGHYPADSAAAIGQLESLRVRGGAMLLFPSTAFWWLDHYKEFAQYLQSHFTCLHHDADCLLYDLSAPPAATE